MNNENNMLQLVLSDSKLSSFYAYRPEDFPNIKKALDSESPIVVIVAKIIDKVSKNSNEGNFKEIYNEVYNYLNQNIE
jgi:hypothetical protein